MVMNCPHCGNEIKDEKAVYCPYCSKLLREMPRKKTAFPIVAGILTIIAACVFVPVGTLFMGAYVWYAIQGHSEGIEVLITGLFGILGFAFGLTSGILSLKRRYFGMSLAGLSMVIFCGFAIIFGMAVRGYRQAVADALGFGVPIIVMAILSLIFVAISKKEFS
jgi:hypothetical protein